MDALAGLPEGPRARGAFMIRACFAPPRWAVRVQDRAPLTAMAPAWYLAPADPVVRRVLRLLQDDPAHLWTVATRAAKAGVFRAALARRFTDLVGEPPMTYLTAWRLALTADRLRDTQDTSAAIARQVRYGSAFALSGAFKRVYGVSP